MQENYAIGLDSWYLFNPENGTQHDIESTCGVCRH